MRAIREAKASIRVITAALLLTMIAWLVPANIGTAEAASATNLSNPRIDGLSTTWDCVYFGTYPQTSEGADKTRIKWRVLNVNAQKTEAILLADQVLTEGMAYNKKGGEVWAKTTIRSWLNGYGKNENASGIDYSADNFMDIAFTPAEQAALKTATVRNKDVTIIPTEGETQHFPGGPTTNDKVYLLSKEEIENPDYGFAPGGGPIWGPVKTRHTTATAYANRFAPLHPVEGYWLRGRGNKSYSAWSVKITKGYDGGYNAAIGEDAGVTNYGARPVIHLDLTKTDLWDSAGTTDANIETSFDTQSPTVIQLDSRITKRLGDAPFYLNEQIKNGNNPTYKSGNTKVAVIDSSGKITLKGAGTTNITVTIPQSRWFSGGSKTAVLTVLPKESAGKPVAPVKKAQTITARSYTKTYGNKAFNLNAKANGGGKLTYRSSNSKVAAVSSSGRVTLKAPGRATITISAAATGAYNAAKKNIAITVKPKKVIGTKAKTGKRKMTVSWKRDKKATGYQITYARNKKFTKGKKNVTIGKNKTTKRTIKKLKKKTYYVKVRAFKKVGKTKIYGSYSKARKCRVR